jgi:hypothetical protein
MSRGLGETQRFVLAELGRDREEDRRRRWRRGWWTPFWWVTALDLAQRRAGGPPTPADLEAIRRAIRTLAARGLVKADHWAWIDRRHFEHRPARRMLYVRLPLSAEEQEREAAWTRREKSRQEKVYARLTSRR